MTGTPYMVVLHFASGLKVDLVQAETERIAIADCTAKALRSCTADLPLIDARVAEVPVDRLLELAGILQPPAPPPQPRPSVSLVGMIGAVRRYLEAVAASRETASHVTARAALAEFFDLHGVDLDYRIAAPPSARISDRASD